VVGLDLLVVDFSCSVQDTQVSVSSFLSFLKIGFVSYDSPLPSILNPCSHTDELADEAIGCSLNRKLVITAGPQGDFNEQQRPPFHPRESRGEEGAGSVFDDTSTVSAIHHPWRICTSTGLPRPHMTSSLLDASTLAPLREESLEPRARVARKPDMLGAARRQSTWTTSTK
jgi:hypothetical protein